MNDIDAGGRGHRVRNTFWRAADFLRELDEYHLVGLRMYQARSARAVEKYEALKDQLRVLEDSLRSKSRSLSRRARHALQLDLYEKAEPVKVIAKASAETVARKAAVKALEDARAADADDETLRPLLHEVWRTERACQAAWPAEEARHLACRNARRLRNAQHAAALHRRTEPAIRMPASTPATRSRTSHRRRAAAKPASSSTGDPGGDGPEPPDEATSSSSGGAS